MAKKKKKKGGGSSSNHMTSAERTRARMRAQEQAQAERAEAAAAQAKPSKVATDKAERRPEPAPAPAREADDVEDIDAQIAALQRRKAELEGRDAEPSSSSSSGTKAKPSKRADDERRRPQAYPGEDKLRRAQGKLEEKAAAWDANPTVNRIVCAVIDFFVGGVVIMGPAALTYYYMSGTNSMGSLSDFLSIGQPMAVPVGLAIVGLALGFFYYVIVPWKIWPGQTLGKHLGHIHIVRRDRRDLDFWTIFLRQFVGVMFLELGLTCDFLLVPQLITLVSGSSDAGSLFQSTGVAITVVSIVLFSVSQKRLALHDRFAGTRVE